MSAEVTTQTRSESSRGTGRRGNKPRGAGATNQPSGAGRGGNRNARPKKGLNTKDAVADEAVAIPETSVESVEPVDASEQVAAAVAASESGDADVCWICAEPVKYYAISECNHRTCHVCAIRLRALYKKMECTFCKEKQNSVIFTVSPDARFATFRPEDIPHKDAKLSVYFETQEMMEDSLLLLRFNCPDRECDYMGNGWGDLRLHVRASHGKLMCDLCIRFKKVFSHEHALYTPGVLPVHLPSMPQRPSKAALKEQVEGGIHPLCVFCRECFFSDDELYAHMREKHEECFICKRNEVRDQYFQNYESLERHFNTDHHPCNQTECQARKFVVFNTPLDLKAHLVEEHGGDMSSKDRKDARRIQADFTFEEVGHGARHGRRDRERDRDRDRDREPPPQPRQQQQPQQASSSGPPPGRAAPPVSRRREGFGGALTEPGAATPSSVDHATRPLSPQPTTDVDPAVAERHAGFLARLHSLAANPSAAVPAVKAAARSYRATESSPRDFILTIWNVMDRNLEQTASIVNAFVDLVDEEEKKQEILSSWKGFAIEQRRQFPDLAPLEIGSGYAGIASGRVLSAKHATATRSSQSQQVWNRVALAASSSSDPSINFSPARPQERFPALGAGASTSSSSNPTPAPAARQGQRKTPWSGSAGQPQSFRGNATPPPPPSTLASRSSTPKGPPPKLTNSLFPELPPSSTARSKPQVKGNVSLKNILGSSSGPAIAAWNTSAGSGSGTRSGDVTPALQVQPTEESNADVPALGAGGGGGGGKGRKAKGKQKQTLFTLGTFPT